MKRVAAALVLLSVFTLGLTGICEAKKKPKARPKPLANCSVAPGVYRNMTAKDPPEKKCYPGLFKGKGGK